MAKKTSEVVETEVEATEEEAVEVSEAAEEVVETRGEFSVVSKGDEYGVRHNGVLIAPFGSRAEADQLFRGMTRKF